MANKQVKKKTKAIIPPEKNYVLIRQSYNWSDEIDFEGYWVGPASHWERKKAFFEEVRYPQSFYVGTNEEIEYTSADEYLATFQVINRLTDAEFSQYRALSGKPASAESFKLGDILDIEEYGAELADEGEEDEDL